MDRETVERELVETLRAEPGLAAAYLFGSFARDAALPSSDVDVAVLYQTPPEAVLGSAPTRLEGALERRLKRAVQVVCLNRVPPDLGIRVLREGRLLLEPDRGRRIRFEVALRNAYWDLEPILRQCRKRTTA